MLNELRNQLTHNPLVNHAFHGEPLGFIKRRDSWSGQARQHFDNPVKTRLGHVHLEADFRLCAQRALQQQGNLIDLLPFFRVL